jgi:signal transduction histidine kinase
MADPTPPNETAWVWRVLRTPLLTKLVFLDLAVNLLAFLLLQVVPAEDVTEVTFVSLLVIAVANAGVVAWALQPLAALEDTARRVSAGEFTARTHLPPFTDRNLARIGRTFDALLDRVDADRRRLRTLASEVVAAGDRERAHIARELHDGTAQSLSALDMLLATALRDASPTDQKRLTVMREVVTEALSEVRALAHNVHPRVLDDLGLPSALAALGRRTRAQGSGPEVVVGCEGDRPLPQPVSSVLYRVAQEAVHNAVKHAGASAIRVALALRDDRATLEVADDGRGFSRDALGEGRGMGLFVMEERVVLVGGRFEVSSAPGAGTRVRVEIPLADEPAVLPALGGAA